MSSNEEPQPKDFQGKVIIFTAPSGGGKTTIVRHLLNTYQDDLDFSVSATSREIRPGEENGKDYYFLTKEEFENKIQAGAFLEWEEVYKDLFYGTLKSEVERIWSLKKHIIFDVDVKGAQSIKSHFGDQCLAIFIKPPSLNILVNRLKSRGTEDEKSLRKRITRVKHEMTYEHLFDKILVNDILEVAQKEAALMVEEFIFKEYKFFEDDGNTNNEGY